MGAFFRGCSQLAVVAWAFLMALVLLECLRGNVDGWPDFASSWGGVMLFVLLPAAALFHIAAAVRVIARRSCAGEGAPR